MILSFKAHTENIAETENMKKSIAVLESRQSALENSLRKMVASDLDVDINDPEEQKGIAQTLEKVLAGKWNLFVGE